MTTVSVVHCDESKRDLLLPVRHPRHLLPVRGRVDGRRAGNSPRWPSNCSPRASPAGRRPFSEAAFKTLKYRPEFPDRFGSIEHARAFCRRYFDWYNTEHYHSGIAWRHPIDVHSGRAEAVQAMRADVLAAAYERHPERFVRKHPEPGPLPEAAWINKPPAQHQQQQEEPPTHSTNP